MDEFRDSEEERALSDATEDEGPWSCAWDADFTEKGVAFASSSTSSKHAAGVPASDGGKPEVKAVAAATSVGSTSACVSRMLLNDNKAGMEGLDKEKINAIIYEASKGSKYYENEVKKEQQVNRRLDEQKYRRSQITQQQLEEAERVANELLQQLERTRDLSRSIVHVDMDMFYAAVEMRDDPTLKTKPMAVGGNSMLSTSNYIARKYGVRAAMPGFIGRKLCPDLVIVPTNFEKYTEVSNQVRAILGQYDANFSPMSLDEAYLDFTDHLTERQHFTDEERTFPTIGEDVAFCACRMGQQKIHEKLEEGLATRHCETCGKRVSGCDDSEVFGLTVEEAVREMRHRIHLTTRLTASAGIAPNTMLAKVCSDKNKPNGQHRVHPSRESVMTFIHDLPIRKVSGIGKVSEKMLLGLGVVTCTDLFTHRAVLYYLYSDISFNYFMRICKGLGSTRVERDGERKSMSTERTFLELSRAPELFAMCSTLSRCLADDLGAECLVGKTVTLKIKTVNFEVKTRAQTLPSYTQNQEQIFEAARNLLKTEMQACAPNPLRLRLMGVRMSNLGPVSELGKHRQDTITAFLKKWKTPVESKEPIEPSSEDLKSPAESASSITINETDTDSYTRKIKSKETEVHKHSEPVICPVCSRVIKTARAELINEHIDFCLEKSAVTCTPTSDACEMQTTTERDEKGESCPHSVPVYSKVDTESDSKQTRCGVTGNEGGTSDLVDAHEDPETPPHEPDKGRSHDNELSASSECYMIEELLKKMGRKKSSTASSFGVTCKLLFHADDAEISANLTSEADVNTDTADLRVPRDSDPDKSVSPSRSVASFEDRKVTLTNDNCRSSLTLKRENAPTSLIDIPVVQDITPTQLTDSHGSHELCDAHTDRCCDLNSEVKCAEEIESIQTPIPTAVRGNENVEIDSGSLKTSLKTEERYTVGVDRGKSVVPHLSKEICSETEPCGEKEKQTESMLSEGSANSTCPPVGQGSNFEQTTTSAKAMFTCPVCSMKVSSSLGFFNKHIDNCLSKQTIRDMVKDNQVSRTARSAAKKSPSGQKIKNPKEAKRRRIDNNQKSISNFMTSLK